MTCYEKYFRSKEEMDAAFEKIQRIVKETGCISHRQYLRCCGIKYPDFFYGPRYWDSPWYNLDLVWYNGSDFGKGLLTIGGVSNYYIWANVHPQTPTKVLPIPEPGHRGEKKVYIVTSTRKDHKDLRAEFKTFGAAERYIRSICPEAIRVGNEFKCFGSCFEYRMLVRKVWRADHAE